ncbi:MAG: FkbM family methyltransferase [Cyanobacteria bacterium J06560_6]
MQLTQHKSEKKSEKGFLSIRGHHFFADLITSNSIVLDLGAHLGQFSQEVSRLFNCHCYAIEAHPKLHEKIESTQLLSKFNYAIFSENKPVTFCTMSNPETNHISIDGDSDGEMVTVEGITLKRFMKQQKISTIDLLKVDIEGAEVLLFDSIDDELIRSIKQITVEFHDFMLDISSEVKSIKARLKSLGFEYIVFSNSTNGDVLFINQSVCNISPMRYAYARYVGKYIKGLSRRLARGTK